MKGSFHMKKQILTGVLLSVLAMSSAYAHKDDKKDAKKPKLSTELVVAQNDQKDAEKSSVEVAHKDKEAHKNKRAHRNKKARKNEEAHKDKKDAKSESAQNDKKDAKKPKLGTELVVAQKDDKKDAKKPKHSA